MTAPMNDDGRAPPGADESLLRDAAARAERLAASLAAHEEGLPPDGQAAMALVTGAVERLRASLDSVLRRGTRENCP